MDRLGKRLFSNRILKLLPKKKLIYIIKLNGKISIEINILITIIGIFFHGKKFKKCMNLELFILDHIQKAIILTK